MAKYNVIMKQIVKETVLVEVEAESKEAAKRKLEKLIAKDGLECSVITLETEELSTEVIGVEDDEGGY